MGAGATSGQAIDGFGRHPVRTLVVASLAALLVAIVLPPRPAAVDAQTTTPAAGTLDETFADGGIAITEISSFVDARDAAVQVVDGAERILVLERHGNTIWRFHPDGTLDTTFDDDGVVNPSRTFFPLGFTPERVAVNPVDNSFVAAGFRGTGVRPGVQIARWHADGTRDHSIFPLSGQLAVPGGQQPQDLCTQNPRDLEHTFDGFADVGFLSDGSIVVIGPGQVEEGSASCLFLTAPGLVAARIDPAGDITVVGIREGNSTDPRALTVTDDDRVLVSAAAEIVVPPDEFTTTPHVVAIGLSADLSLDPDFAAGGIASTVHPNSGALPVAVAPDGTVGIVAERVISSIENGGGSRLSWSLLRCCEAQGNFLERIDATFPAGVNRQASPVAGLAISGAGDFVATGTVRFIDAARPPAVGKAVYSTLAGAPDPGPGSGALEVEDLEGEPPCPTDNGNDDGPPCPDELAQSLAGEGVTISNVTYTGDPRAAGSFGGGENIVGIDQGVILSSGQVVDVVGPNDDRATSTSFDTPGDADLDGLVDGDTQDAAVLEFEFVPDAERVFFQYVFGSEEYNEWVGSNFNDVFGFFVNGENCAVVNGDTPVSVNTVNNGTAEPAFDFDSPDEPVPPTNPHLFVNNDPRDPDFFGDLVAEENLRNTEMDGFTRVLTCEGTVAAGESNTMKLAIADRRDTEYDSWVLIEAASLTTEAPPIPVVGGTASVIPHPGPPPTGVTAAALVRLQDGSLRATGRSEPEVFGLDNHRKVLLTRIDADGSFSSTFGPDGNGFAQHHGRYGDEGKAVAVLPDGRIVGAGAIPITGVAAADPPTGFVLRHLEDGPLDPTFAPDPYAGIEITRYGGLGAGGALPASAPEADLESMGTGSTAGESVSGTAAPLVAPTQFLPASAHEIEVTNDSDADPGSFRDAIKQASTFGDPVVIVFTDDFEVFLEDEVEYTGVEDLTILGRGSTLHGGFEDNGDVHRILRVSNDNEPRLWVEDLAFEDGHASSGGGGAINSAGSVTTVNAVFRNNQATNGSGGAIRAGGRVEVHGSHFADNTAINTTGNGSLTDGHGGAIFAAGTVTAVGTTFSDNTATDGSGGAILARDRVEVLSGSTFVDNAATKNAESVGTGNGGAISTAIGIVGEESFDVTVADSALVRNKANAGGAIQAGSGDVRITNSAFDANEAESGGGAVVGRTIAAQEGSTFTRNTAALGAAFFALHVVAADSSFTNNSSGGPGAISASGDVEVIRSRFEDNVAEGPGGAIHAFRDVRVRDGSMFLNNRATRGGAIQARSEITDSSVTINDSQFISNRAGGGFTVGGAIDVGGPISIASSQFVRNGNAHSGGAIWAAGGATVDGSLFSGNGAFANGSAMYVERLGNAEATVEVTGSTFEDNGSTSLEGEGVATGDGGAIRVEGEIIVDDSRFLNNASAHGGAIATFDAIVRNGSIFSGNRAEFFGGAIWATDPVLVSRSTFEKNTAGIEDGSFQGGGAITGNDTVTVIASTFIGNSADVGEGGAIQADDDLFVTDSTFNGNSAASDGGAILTGGNVLAVGSTFVGNDAGDDGGAILAFRNVTAVNSTLTGNTGVAGGAIWADLIDLVYVTVAGNAGRSQLHADDGIIDSFGSVVANPESGANCDVGEAESSYSYDTDGTCLFAGPGDTSNGPSPQLGALADNGGLTATMLPAGTSPLVNAIPEGDCAGDIDTDQRGVIRPQGGACDIGAVERDVDHLDIAVQGMAVDGEGRVIVVGSTDFGRRGVINRLLPDGSTDPTFRGGLPFTMRIGQPATSTSGVLRDVAVDAQGRIVAVGDFQAEVMALTGATQIVGPFVAVVRLLPDGSLDPTFGDVGFGQPDDFVPAGLVVPVREGRSAGHGIAIDDAGRIVFAGSIRQPDQSRELLVGRLLTDGSPDPSFGTAGLIFGPRGFEARDVAVHREGIVVAGIGPGWEGNSAFVARLRANGTLDAGFGIPLDNDDFMPNPPAAGFAFPFRFQSFNEEAHGVTTDPVGNIVVVGRIGRSRDGMIALARLLPDGTHDPSFGNPGVVTTDVGGGSVANDVAIAPDGKIVLIGHVEDDRGKRNVVARYNPGESVLTCTPDPVPFGSVTLGSNQTLPVTCTASENTVVVTDTAVDPASAHPGDFQQTPGTCQDATLRPGESCTLQARFQPTAEGQRQAAIDVSYTGVQGAGSVERVALVGTGTVVVDPPLFAVDPDEGPVETEFVGTGERYLPGLEVEVSIAGLPITTVPAGQVAGDGSFTVDLVVPEGTPGGEQPVVACQRCGQADEVSASALFTVTPRLFVTPPLGRPGGVVEAFGDGFPAETPVLLGWLPGLGTATTLSDVSGEISTPMLLFRNDIIGPRELEARISGAPEVVATVEFLAVPGSAQPGDFAIRR